MSTSIGGQNAAVGAAVSSAGGSGGSLFPIRTTLPPEVLRHDISDEQLETLRRGHSMSQGLSEGMWAFVGGVIGAAPGAVTALYRAYVADAPVPLGGENLAQVVVFVVSVAVSATIFIIQKRAIDPIETLVSDIRSRTNNVSRQTSQP